MFDGNTLSKPVAACSVHICSGLLLLFLAFSLSVLVPAARNCTVTGPRPAPVPPSPCGRVMLSFLFPPAPWPGAALSASPTVSVLEGRLVSP